ncbi:MAG: hypothetical protein LBU07_05100 [Coriobacteriales bacterium]|jgi:hypothetical protein|nr:hypothetical protein [Coriobacteriales bacterium]
MSSIKPEQLEGELYATLARYSDDVREAAAEQTDITARDIVDELRAASPRESGDYARGWGTKSDAFGARGAFGRTVYQRSKPSLTHLLEHGHAKRGGVGRVAGIPHIAPVEQRYADIYPQRVLDAIRKIV